MQVKLTKVSRKTTDKEGNPLKTRDGRPYTRLSIQTQEHGAKWLSGFNNAQTANWKEGDSVEMEVTEKGEYLNFSVPKKEDKNAEILEKIQNTLVAHRLLLEEIKAHVIPRKPKYDEGEADYPEMEGEPTF